MGIVNVTYQIVGPAIEMLDTSSPSDWTLITYDAFKRTYTYGDFSITIVGDFGTQTTALTGETLVFFIDYLNGVTGEGARISGINTPISSGVSLSNFAVGHWVRFTGSDLADDINIAGAAGSNIHALGGNDRIDGSYDSDTIDAGAGDDTILGDWGMDLMTGGPGKDVFRYNDQNDSFYFGRHFPIMERITDFSTKDDHFDFRKFEKKDENSGKWVDADFAFIGRNHFTGNGDELRFVQTFDRKDNPITFIYGNLDDDMRPELVIELDGHVRLRADDFYL